MPTGARILNTSGTVQIDQTYKNLALKQKGQITTGSDGINPSLVNFRQKILRVTATFPLMALQSSVYAVVDYVYRVNANTWDFYIRTSGTTAVTLTYYLFDQPGTPTQNYGLRVFNPVNGQLTYHSEFKYLRIADQISGDIWRTGRANDFGPRTYESGRQYAVITTRRGTGLYMYSASTFGETSCGSRSITNGIELGPVPFQISNGSGDGQKFPFMLLVVDVTDY